MNKILDNATAGLRRDRELYLDIRAELAAHLEDTVDSFRAEGFSEEESRKKALAAFGDTEEISSELMAANASRLRFRSALRVVVRAVVVPTAVLLSIAIAWSLLIRYNNVVQAHSKLDNLPPPLPMELRYHLQTSCTLEYTDPVERLPAEKAFYFTGDLSRETKSAQQRAIWELEPENRIYLGNYISELFAQTSPDLLDIQEKETLAAQHIDPDNSRYEYLRAYALAECSSDIKPRSGGHRVVFEVTITDREMLDRAMVELLMGHRKNTYRRYGLEMLRKRRSLLPPVRRIEEQAERLTMTTQANTPDNSALMYLARVVPVYARLLAEEGNTADAGELLATWRCFVLKLNDDASTAVDVATMQRIAATVDPEIADVYELLGKTAEAKIAVQQADEIQYIIKEATARHRPPRSGSVETSGSLIAKLATFTSAGDLSPELLRNGRWAEHVLMEQVTVLAAMVALLLLLAGSGLMALRSGGKSQAIPAFLILPSNRSLLRILALALGLPLVVYYVYSRWSGFAGREYSVSYLPARFAFEMLLLIITILYLYCSLALQTIRRRCAELQVCVPPVPARAWRIVTWLLIAVLWAACISIPVGRAADQLKPAVLAVSALLAGTLLLRLVGIFVRGVFRRAEHALFYGTVARSSVPLWALAILVLGLFVYPLLNVQEARYLQNESIYSDNAGGILINAEYARTLLIKSRIRKLTRSSESFKKAGSTGGQENAGAGPVRGDA